MARAWQRPLRRGFLETFVDVDGHKLYLVADVERTDALIALWESSVKVKVPPFERKIPRYGRPRLPKPVDGQLVFDVTAEAA